MSALRATTSLIVVQVFSRLSTFAINQASLRYLSPTLLGASTQLELFSTTLLTFARDSLRVALAREGYDPNLQGVINAAHAPAVLGVPLALLFKLLYERAGLPDVPNIDQAVNLVAIAGVVEMLAEPAFALVQVKGEFGIRAFAETTATVVRCIVTFLAVVYADARQVDTGVMPFAYGQMAYACGILLVYLWHIAPILKATQVRWFPKRITIPGQSTKDSYFLGLIPGALIWLTFTLSAQTIVKQLLGEGDHVVMALFASLEEQGAYDLAHNYGSLVARMGLQPVEEGCRGLFGRLCADKKEHSKEAEERKRPDGDNNRQKTSNTAVQQALSTLGIVLRLYSLFSLICLSVGPTIAPLLLRLIAGAKWSDSSVSSAASSSAGAVLSVYCYLLPLMAFNGILEAFVSAVATPTELYHQSVVMGVFTACFGAASFLFLGYLHLGAQGLVLAQCVAMALRIIWSWRFSSEWFRGQGLTLQYLDFLPNPMSIAFSVIAAASIRRDLHLPKLDILEAHISPTIWTKMDAKLLEQLVTKGGLCVLTAGAIFATERDFWMEQYRVYRPAATTEDRPGQKLK